MVMAPGVFLKGTLSVLRCHLSVPAFAVRLLLLGISSSLSLQSVAQTSEAPLSHSLPLRVAQSDHGAEPEANGSPISQLFVKLTELESLVQSLTGRLERVQHENEQLRKRLDLYMEDSNARLRDLEASRLESSKVDSSRASVSGKRKCIAQAKNLQLPEGTPEKKYKYAFGLLRDSKYEAARRALRMFIEHYPEHDLVANAQYWIGETFYACHEFEKAVLAFSDGYRKYPKNSKAPDNLLKLALSMESLGKSKEACISLKKLASDYPNTSDTIKRRVSIELSRLKCL